MSITSCLAQFLPGLKNTVNSGTGLQLIRKKMKTIGKLYFIEPVNDGKEDKSLYRQRAGGEYHLLVLPFLDIYQLKVLLVLAPWTVFCKVS